MLPIKSKVPFTIQNPYRYVRPTTKKVIFLSCEGSVTEEEYFDIVSEIFEALKNKIQFISVVEDAVRTHHKSRTGDQAILLSKNRPKQLVEKIEQFKLEKEPIYEFSKYPEDEFWIVADIDSNTAPEWIDEFECALDICDEKGYGYAISNPFFEMWLLLHHVDAVDEDKAHAVTDEHPYTTTNHFRERLRVDAGARIKDKHIDASHYSESKIKKAVERAKALHNDKSNRWPKYFATTVYLLLEKIINSKEVAAYE